MWDPFSVAVALGPMSAYLIALGGARWRNRVVILSGSRDFAALAFGMMGWLIIGPMDLFFPRPAVLWLGRYVWVFLILLYWLIVAWIILNARHRLVIYGIAGDGWTRKLSSAVRSIDLEARVTELSIQIPSIGVEGYIEHSSIAGVCQIVATSSTQTSQGWRELEAFLGQQLQEANATTIHPWQHRWLLFMGVVLLAISLALLLNDPSQTISSATQFMRG